MCIENRRKIFIYLFGRYTINQMNKLTDGYLLEQIATFVRNVPNSPGKVLDALGSLIWLLIASQQFLLLMKLRDCSSVGNLPGFESNRFHKSTYGEE